MNTEMCSQKQDTNKQITTKTGKHLKYEKVKRRKEKSQNNMPKSKNMCFESKVWTYQKG